MRYCSIGPDCHSSALLKLINLKTESYPFDWSVSSLTKILDCIEDKFAKFLDKSLYYKKEEHNAGHTHYGDKLFFHRNPLKQQDYEYYQRCTKRFLDLLKSDEPKTFLYITIKPIKEEVLLFDTKLREYCKNYRIICVVYNQKRPVHKYSLSIQSNLYFFTIDILSEKTGSYLKNPNDTFYVSKLILTKI